MCERVEHTRISRTSIKIFDKRGLEDIGDYPRGFEQSSINNQSLCLTLENGEYVGSNRPDSGKGTIGITTK
jgi:hypothetical protein